MNDDAALGCSVGMLLAVLAAVAVFVVVRACVA